MSDSDLGMLQPPASHGWRVVFAGLGINLALAIMYTWSVISNGVPDAWGWSQANKSLPFSVSGLFVSAPDQHHAPCVLLSVLGYTAKATSTGTVSCIDADGRAFS